MRFLLGLLLASCSIPVAAPVPTTPPHFAAFANALCDRDATYVAAHVSGRLLAPASQIAAALNMRPTCTAAKYIATDDGRPIFLLTEEGKDIPYLFTFDPDQKVADIR